MATKAKSTKKKGNQTSEDLWAREWQIQLGYDNDPVHGGGGAVLYAPNKTNTFALEKMETSGLKAKAYRAVQVANGTTTDYWKDAVFFEMGSKTLSLPTVIGLRKPYPLYKAPPPGPLSQANADALKNHKKLLDACMKKVKKNTMRLVAGIPVSKPNSHTVVEYIFLYCIKYALLDDATKKKHLLLIDLRDTSAYAGASHQGGTGSGYSTRP